MLSRVWLSSQNNKEIYKIKRFYKLIKNSTFKGIDYLTLYF